MSISWPAQLNSQCALQLVVRGYIIRSENGTTAMNIQQYDFKTARR
jgi:hypothetical protein